MQVPRLPHSVLCTNNRTQLFTKPATNSTNSTTSRRPREQRDLSASLPAAKAQLMANMVAANKTAHQTNDTPGESSSRVIAMRSVAIPT